MRLLSLAAAALTVPLAAAFGNHDLAYTVVANKTWLISQIAPTCSLDMSAMTLSMRFPSHGHSNNSVAHTIAYTDRPYREAQAVPNYRFEDDFVDFFLKHGDTPNVALMGMAGSAVVNAIFEATSVTRATEPGVVVYALAQSAQQRNASTIPDGAFANPPLAMVGCGLDIDSIEDVGVPQPPLADDDDVGVVLAENCDTYPCSCEEHRVTRRTDGVCVKVGKTCTTIKTKCNGACEWDAPAPSDSDDNPTAPTCGDRITFLVEVEGESRADACTQISTVEYPEICGGCTPGCGGTRPYLTREQCDDLPAPWTWCPANCARYDTDRLGECAQCDPHYELTSEGLCEPCVVCSSPLMGSIDLCPIYSEVWGGVIPKADDGSVTLWPDVDQTACDAYVRWGASGYDVEDPDEYYCEASHPVAWVYNITVSQFDADFVDGVTRPYIWMRSGEDTEYKIPGRPVSACAKDTIVAQVHNAITPETTGSYGDWDEAEQIRMGVTLHWHGMLQLNHQIMDGVAMISQCPIGPNVPVDEEHTEPGTPSHYTYRMLADPAGTFWFHSHTGLQYGDGLFGPLLVYQRAAVPDNPYRQDYDKELGVALMIGDWWHKLSQELAVNLFFGPEQAETCEATQAHCIPRGNLDTNSASAFNCLCGGRSSDYYFKSGHINGLGQYDPTYNYTEVKVQPATTYRVRLINSGFNYGLRFSIDDHEFRVIAADGSFIKSVDGVTHLATLPGERYDILLTTKTAPGQKQYFIRATTYRDNLWFFNETANRYEPRFTEDSHTVFAVLNYDASSTVDDWFQAGQPLQIALDAYKNGEPLPTSATTRKVVDVSYYYTKERYFEFEGVAPENVITTLTDYRDPSGKGPAGCTSAAPDGKGPLGAPYGCQSDGTPLETPRPDHIQVLMIQGSMFPQYQLAMSSSPLLDYEDWYDPLTDTPKANFKDIYKTVTKPNIWQRATRPLVHTRGDPKYNRDLPVHGPPLDSEYSDPNTLRPARRWGLSTDASDWASSPLYGKYGGDEDPGITNSTKLVPLPYNKWVRFIFLNGGPMAHPFHTHGYDIHLLSRNALDPDGPLRERDSPCTKQGLPPGREPLLLEDELEECHPVWKINQCVGCTRKFFTKSFLGDDAAVLARSSGEEPASPRHRAGVASMAWRSTRRFSTSAP